MKEPEHYRPINTLISYHYFKRSNIEKLKNNELRLVGDSGAYSAMTQGTPIDIDEFAAWAIKWRDSLCWIASLDVIGDSHGTWKNWRILKDEFNLDVVPTIHYGSAPKEIDKYVEQGCDYIGLGGMVSKKSEPAALLRWAAGVFAYAKKVHPEVRFHGWGITHKDVLMRLPWFSVDSTGWAYSIMMGRHSLWNPKEGKFIRFPTDGKSAYKYSDLIRDHYGLEPADIAYSKPENYRVTLLTSVRAYQLLEAHLRRRFDVTPPSYALDSNTVNGPHIHLANGSTTVFEKVLVPKKE